MNDKERADVDVLRCLLLLWRSMGRHDRGLPTIEDEREAWKEAVKYLKSIGYLRSDEAETP